MTERAPLDVLTDFGDHSSNDKVLGENLIQFINFLQQHLDSTRPRSTAEASGIPQGAKIFIDHAEDDIDYAMELAATLQELSFTPRFPILEGRPSLRTAQNRRYVEECAAVALCWGSATEAWVMGEAHRLDQWRRSAQLDRLRATLLATPPTHKLKRRWLLINPPGIDRVVDWTDVDKPSPAHLRDLLWPEEQRSERIG